MIISLTIHFQKLKKLIYLNNMSASKNFFNALKDDPQSIIEWCENEIKEYKKLIKLIKKYEGGNFKTKIN